MKVIKAFIRPEKLSDISTKLNDKGHCCLTVFEGEGTGKYTDPEKDWPSFKFPQMHSKVIKLELVYRDEDVWNIIDIILENGSTGRSGDGLIYISDVNEAVRIRDGQKGKEILHH